MAILTGRSPPLRRSVFTDAIVAAQSDTVDLPSGPCRGLYIGVAGALKVDTADGSTVVFPNVVAGQIDISVKRVWVAGTTATGIIALY